MTPGIATLSLLYALESLGQNGWDHRKVKICVIKCVRKIIGEKIINGIRNSGKRRMLTQGRT